MQGWYFVLINFTKRIKLLQHHVPVQPGAEEVFGVQDPAHVPLPLLYRKPDIRTSLLVVVADVLGDVDTEGENARCLLCGEGRRGPVF